MNYIPERPGCEDLEDGDDNDPEDMDDPDGKDDIAAAIRALASFQARRSSGASNKSGERRMTTAATRCFNCGGFGHFKRDCPKPPKRGLGQFRSKTPNFFKPPACRLCGGEHFVRECPDLPLARKFLEREKSKPSSDPQTPKPQSLSQTPNEPDASFKRNGTATLSKAAPRASSNESPVKLVDSALPAMSQESTPGTPRMQLFSYSVPSKHFQCGSSPTPARFGT